MKRRWESAKERWKENFFSSIRDVRRNGAELESKIMCDECEREGVKEKRRER